MTPKRLRFRHTFALALISSLLLFEVPADFPRSPAILAHGFMVQLSNQNTSIQTNVQHDTSLSLRRRAGQSDKSTASRTPKPAPTGGEVEQRSQGTRPSAEVVASFDGLGFGFEGPQGVANVRNPSDNSLAVGPDHIVQIVNTRMAVFTKKGKRFDTTGRVLYGPVVTNAVFAGFGGPCETRNNGDAVIRYDQLARRWLIVMPLFGRAPKRPDQPREAESGEPAQVSPPGRPNQPGAPFQLVPPATPNPTNPNRASAATAGDGPYSMCYAVSRTSDPLGEYYRYEFLRAYFPDYPRPAVWPDGYYVPILT